MRRMQYKQKQKESQLIRLFIYNVHKKFNVDHVYDHFVEQNVKIVDLWQSSHVDARKKSFVIEVSRNEAHIISNDTILDELYIGVREYNDRSDQSKFV